MIIKDARFLASNNKFDKLPKDNLPEYAFIGRSNVGKSSLINALVQRNGLAKTSATPGKTISINHFIVNNQWYLVDLPGYGYAKRPKKSREEWRVMLSNYISSSVPLYLWTPELSPKTATSASWNGSAKTKCLSASSSPKPTN